MAVAGNQQPITVSHTELLTGETITTIVQPLVGLDGGDGTRAAAATKETDNVWHPMAALEDSTEFVAAPATRTTTTADNCSVIAAGLAKI